MQERAAQAVQEYVYPSGTPAPLASVVRALPLTKEEG